MNDVIRPISHSSTNERVAQLVKDRLRPGMRVLDLGAGEGYFAQLIGEFARSKFGLDPAQMLDACDVTPSIFRYSAIQCRQIAADGAVPFEDERYDIVCSIEVIEHVEDQFAFSREIVRVLKPGGLLVVSTPNVLNLNSRWRSLVVGFPTLFNPLPLSSVDVVHTSGHIHPVSYYYLSHALLRAGAVDVQAHFDRIKRSAVWLLFLSWPLLLLGNVWFRTRLRRKQPSTFAENRGFLREINSLEMLTSRSIVVTASRASKRAV
jgi:SAM-dependent methyltransferase